MTRKFLFCFPLRLGNVIFGYIIILISIGLVAYNMYKMGMGMISDMREVDDKFRNFERIDSIFGSKKGEIQVAVMTAYYASYVAVGMLLFIFSALFTCGAYSANRCLVSIFFCYSFVHLFLTVGLMVWESLTYGWLELGLILASDVILIICLFSVKYLMEAIRTGHMYSRPGEVYYKY